MKNYKNFIELYAWKILIFKILYFYLPEKIMFTPLTFKNKMKNILKPIHAYEKDRLPN